MSNEALEVLSMPLENKTCLDFAKQREKQRLEITSKNEKYELTTIKKT